MVTPATRIKATLLKGVIDKITGDECALIDRENSVKIVLTPKQIRWFQDFLNAQIDMKRKPDIELDVFGIILPVLLKRSWPAIAAGGGALAALLLNRGKSGDGR